MSVHLRVIILGMALSLLVACTDAGEGASPEPAMARESDQLIGVISNDRDRVDVFATNGKVVRSVEFPDAQVSFTDHRFGARVVTFVETASGTDVEVIDLATGDRLLAYSDAQGEPHLADRGRFERWLLITDIGGPGPRVVVDIDAFELVQSPLTDFDLPVVSADRTGELYRIWADDVPDGFVWVDNESGREFRLDESVTGLAMSPSGDRMFVGTSSEGDRESWLVRTMDDELTSASFREEGLSSLYWLDEERVIFDVLDADRKYPRHVVNAFTGELELTIGGSPFNARRSPARFVPAIENDQLVVVDVESGDKQLAFRDDHKLPSFHALTSFDRSNNRFSWFGEDGGLGWVLDGETGTTHEWQIVETDGGDPKTSDDYLAAVLSPSSDSALFPVGTAHRVSSDGTVDRLATDVVTGSICDGGLTVLLRAEAGDESAMVAEVFAGDSESPTVQLGPAFDAVCIG